jgi:hypothetical protein
MSELSRQSAPPRDLTLVLHDVDGRLESPSPDWYRNIARGGDAHAAPIPGTDRYLWLLSDGHGWDVARV